MARFFSYKEIERGLITTPEMISEIAAALMELEMFKQGQAVVFGSVAWGTHTWRSDIDVANFSKAHWDLHVPVGMVLFEFFKQRYGNEDGFTVGEHLMEVLSNQKPVSGNYFLPHISPSTRDHFRLLARVKGEPWKTFLKNLKTIRFRSRLKDIDEYLGIIVRHWAALNQQLIGKPWLSWDDFKALSALENFPKQLMRKILGEKKRLPSPDTVSQIREAFARLEEPWARELVPLFQPFFEIDPAYQALVNEMTNGRKLAEAEYGQRVCQLFSKLPIKDIIQTVEKAYSLPDDYREYAIFLASRHNDHREYDIFLASRR